jgi:hypothetical protein
VLIVDKVKFLSALKTNIPVLKRLALPAIVLLLVPSVLYLPVLIVKTKLGVLMSKLFPEIAIIVLAAGVVVGFFVDLMTTISTTLLYLHTKNQKNKRG